jgi:hypothetical protein
MAWSKEKDLQIKYRYIPEDATNSPSKNKKKTPKKAKHKHDYEPLCIRYFNSQLNTSFMYYGSYCTICGKINGFSSISKQLIKELEKLFPHIVFSFGTPFLVNASQEEKESFENYMKNNFKYLKWDNYDIFKMKYIPDELM